MSASPSRARGRTLRHMEVLLSAAAVAAASCSSKEEGKIDRSWPERHDDDDGPRSRSSTSSGGSSTSSGRFSSSSGYQVVDPVPRPSRCSTISARAFRATAVVTPAPGGRLGVAVDLVGPTASEPIDFVTAVTQSKGADPSTVDKLPGKWVLKTAADVAASAVDVLVNVQCGTETGVLDIHVDLKVPFAVTVGTRGWW